MKEVEYGQKDTISVYAFMRMCGLECPKSNVRISHSIMLRKLALRSHKFDNVVLPEIVSYKRVTSEDIIKGNIVCVVDDMGKTCFYKRPIIEFLNLSSINLSEEERERRRQEIIEQSLKNGKSR